MPTLKRQPDLRPTNSGGQVFPDRFQHAIDSSDNRRFIFCNLQKIKRRLSAQVQPYFVILGWIQFFMFLFFWAQKSLPTKYCIDSYLKYTSYGKFFVGPQRYPSDTYFPSLVILYYGMDIADWIYCPVSVTGKPKSISMKTVIG